MQKPIYLDYMATTPIDPTVQKTMVQCIESLDLMGNPSSKMHSYGRKAATIIEEARREVAALIHANPKQIYWTSGGTEAINWAIKGVAGYYAPQGKHLITAMTEHKAVLSAFEYLSRTGFEVTYLKVKQNGLIELDELNNSIRPDTILVSIMHVNNETGVIQDIQAIGEITRKKGVIFHVDAVQSVGKLAIDVQRLPIDLISMSAHKLYGPKGVGALYISHQPKISLTPLIHGGGQEQGQRSGTLATHQIAGMGTAFAIAHQRLSEDQKHLRQLADYFWAGLKNIPGVHLQGDGASRVPHCFNIGFDQVKSRDLLNHLQDQIAASPGSACSSSAISPSHVLTAMGLSPTLASEAFRISFGRYTTQDKIEEALKAISHAVEQLLIKGI